ncbi:MAG: hypothetical protein IJB74_06855 [Clostridia bacterium]|nr:hypothetical protein [Clostridia bacterium]
MDKNYVFPRNERKAFIISYMGLFILGIFFELVIVYSNNKQGELKDGLDIIIVRLLFIFIALKPLGDIKYRFSKFQFEADSVSIICGKKIRTVSRYDAYNISVMNLLYMHRYGSNAEKFIVIWKVGSKEPENEISPYTELIRYETIVLPYEERFLNELRLSLGVENIPFYPKVLNKKTGDGSVCSAE